MDYYYSGSNVYIKPNFIVVKSQYEGGTFIRSIKQRANEANLKNRVQSGILSKKAISNLRSSINWLVSSATTKHVWSKLDNKSFSFRVNFITLTIPPQAGSVISSKEFQSTLNTFLVYARKYFYLKNYVWKVEQHRDNRLHIHLTTDTFIHHRRLRSAWNRILAKNNFLQEHFSKFGNMDPNSTDVHSVKQIRNLAGYLCKYMAKDPGLDITFKGRIWGCSYSLSDARKCSVFIDAPDISEQLRWTDNSCIQYKPIETPPNLLGEKMRIADLFMMNSEAWRKAAKGVVRAAYNEHRARIRDGTSNIPAEYLMIEGFSERSKKNINFEIINSIPKITCETSLTIPKTGLIQYALQFSKEINTSVLNAE